VSPTSLETVVVLVCRLALDGGRDGFDIVRNILERVSQLTSLRTWPAAGLFLERDALCSRARVRTTERIDVKYGIRFVWEATVCDLRVEIEMLRSKTFD
jgi:hypothetical protein